MKFSLNSEMSLTHFMSFTGNFCDTSQPYKLFTSQYRCLIDNLSKKEHLALKNLVKNRDLIIQKADKGNTVVILNKNDYISIIKVILSDSSKFFVPLLTNLTLNEYTIKDSFSFAEELLNYESNLILASFYVE